MSKPKTDDQAYPLWRQANPAPDLQDLVNTHGGYDKITPEAWAEYDLACVRWEEARRERLVGYGYAKKKKEKNPE